MRIQAYIRILSDEDTIRSIAEETNLLSASVKQLKARRSMERPALWWNWETPRTPIDVENPDAGLMELLQAHKALFPIFKKHLGSETDVYLEVITQYKEGEEPQGLYLSAQTIQLLSEMGGALDNDVELMLSEESHNGGLG